MTAHLLAASSCPGRGGERAAAAAAQVHGREGRLVDHSPAASGRGSINAVTEEEAEDILGPAITAIIAAIPTPPDTPEQVDLLVCLLTGADLQQG